MVVVGSELVWTSITSTGNGSTTDSTMAWNPHLAFYKRQPWLRERSHYQARDGRGLPGPGLRHDARIPVSTKALFAIQNGVPGVMARA